MKTIFLFISIILFSLNNVHSQDRIKVNKFEFFIGESFEMFYSKYPLFQGDEYIDEEFPDDVGQYYYKYTEDGVYIIVKFYKESLYSAYISDELWSGFLGDFNPISFGFKNVGEKLDFINNQYPNVKTELFEKGDIKLNYCSGHFGFLLIEKKIKL
jgi:hypothetical protein